MLPCVNVTIIYESQRGLIDEEMNRREGWTGTGIKAIEAAAVELEIYDVEEQIDKEGGLFRQ